jgi:peptidoglycan hydrolase-like protein with peptidoglycan-binding domain
MLRILAVSAVVLCFWIAPAIAAQTSASVREAQQALKDKGFDPGPIDGIDGPRTRHAVRSYQHQQKLTADGRLNAETLASLGVNAGAGTEMHAAGETIEKSYSKGGKAVAHGSKALGHDVKHGDVVNGAKDFGKGLGHGAKDIGVGTGHAAKDAVVGAKDAVTGDKSTKH